MKLEKNRKNKKNQKKPKKWPFLTKKAEKNEMA
jgi:hypothetical protein